MTALRWHGLTLRKGSRPVLEEVSLALHPGEMLGIVGPNGAGKTALLRCAVGLEGRAVDRHVEIGGVPAARLSPAQRARTVAYLPQQAEAAWPVTVAEAVTLGRLPHGGGKTEADGNAVAAALDMVGMTAFADHSLLALSGGERALVLLARALAVEAGTLLLDEPAAALDPYRQLMVMAILRDLAGQGQAVGVVLHDLSMAARFCHRIAVLDQGRLMAEGAPEAVLTDALLARVYAIGAIRGEAGGTPFLIPWNRLPPGKEP